MSEAVEKEKNDLRDLIGKAYTQVRTDFFSGNRHSYVLGPH